MNILPPRWRQQRQRQLVELQAVAGDTGFLFFFLGGGGGGGGHLKMFCPPLRDFKPQTTLNDALYNHPPPPTPPPPPPPPKFFFRCSVCYSAYNKLMHQHSELQHVSVSE